MPGRCRQITHLEIRVEAEQSVWDIRVQLSNEGRDVADLSGTDRSWHQHRGSHEQRRVGPTVKPVANPIEVRQRPLIRGTTQRPVQGIVPGFQRQS